MSASWRLADAPLLRLNVQLPTIDTNNRIIAFGETYLTANRPDLAITRGRNLWPKLLLGKDVLPGVIGRLPRLKN
jgi:hypothetical protein